MSLNLYIDESGDLGSKGSKHFITSAILLNNLEEKLLKKTVKIAKENQYKKILKNNPELKTYTISNKSLIYFLKKIDKYKIKSYSLIFEKKKVNQRYLKNNHHKVRKNIISTLINNINPKNETIVTIDKFIPKIHK